MESVHCVGLATNSTLDTTATLFTRMAAVGKEIDYSQEQALTMISNNYTSYSGVWWLC